jgi:hypothetical protein
MAVKPSAEVADGIQKVRFGNFEIVNDAEGRPLALGKGTFGRTYQARHCYLETIVALKIITERYVSNPTVRQRFLIEARAVAKLSHPHVARLYDFGEADGVLHYAMEYCAGGSLSDYVAKQGAFSVRQVVEVAQQITGALKCAHGAGFIHRDLKPSNIMLTSEENPLFTKLIDFGLVQPSLPGATHSISDDQSMDGARFLGTPLFASPEQLREEPMDVRTDLFSLGMTLWYLLVGGSPETGSSAAIAASRLSAESYAGRLPTNLPPQLKDILARLLEKDRTKRFASAAEAFSAVNLCASILGFRRARDYTDPKGEFSELEEPQVEVEGPAEVSGPTTIEVEQSDEPLASTFTIAARIHEDFTGLNYVATFNATPSEGVILHVLHPMLLEEAAALKQLKTHVAQLKALSRAEVLHPTAIKQFSDYTAIVVEKPAGNDLLSILRSQRTVQLSHAARLLESIAETCDALAAAGLPGIQLAPTRIFLQPTEAEPEPRGRINPLSASCPKLYPRFLAVSEAPELARLNEPEDVTSTMTTDMFGDPGRADNMPEHFATLLYRIVAGRNCLAAASLSSQAYVPIPGLSEHSNQLLSLVIANQIGTTSCGQVLREILGAEGIAARIAQHPSTQFASRGSGSTITPVDVPPVNRIAPLVTPTPPPAINKRGSSLRAWQPPTVTPHPSTARPIIPQSLVATPPPPVIPQVIPPPIPESIEARTKEIIPPPVPEPVESRAPEIVSPPVSEPVEARTKEIVAPSVSEPTETRAKESVSIPEPAEALKEVVSPSVPEPTEARTKEAAIPPFVPSPDAEAIEKKTPPPAKTKSASKKLKEKFTRKIAIPSKPKEEEEETRSLRPTPSEPAIKQSTAPLPVVLPTPPVTRSPAPAIAEEEPSRPRISWRDPKVQAIGLGIAALLVVFLSVGVALKVMRHPKPIVTGPVAPTETQPQPSTPPVPHIAHITAGRYVGRLARVNLRNRQASVNTPAALEREISIDPNSPSGYVIEYGDDPTRQIPLADGHLDAQGEYIAHVMFASASNGAHADETLTVKPTNDSNSLEVMFRPSSGEQYAFSGSLHSWSGDDQAHQDKLIADRAEAAAQRERDAAQARLEAEARATAEQQQQIAAKAAIQPPPPAAASTTSTHHRASAGGDSSKAAGTTTHQASAPTQRTVQAPPPQPPSRPAPRPAPPRGETQKPARAFQGGVPGG